MPGDTLNRGLAAKVAIDERHEGRLAALRDQWNLFLLEGREMAIRSIPDEETVLLSQSRKLYAAWTKFCQRLPNDQRYQLEEEIPNLQYLVQSVEKASKTWKEKREGEVSGRLKQIFANLCSNFKDHSTLFLTSFDERAFDRLFHEKKGRIRAIEQRMLRLTTLEFQSGITEKVNKLESGFQLMFNRQENAAEDQRNLLLELGTNIRQLFDYSIGQQALQITEMERPLAIKNAAQSALSSESLLDISKSSTSKSMTRSDRDDLSCVDHSRKGSANIQTVHYRRESILHILGPLITEYGQDGQALLPITSRAPQLMIDLEVQKHLRFWSKEPILNGLWIQGPHDVLNPSQNTLTAVFLVALSKKNGIPCVFYFCDLTAHTSSGSPQTYCQRALMKMVKSLTIQVASLIPASFGTTLDLSLARLEKLREDALKIDEVLNLFGDLRSLAPPYLHCVISGLQDLEDRDDVKQTQNLSCVLTTLTRIRKIDATETSYEDLKLASDQVKEVKQLSRTTKLCFTTDGYVDALAKLVEQDCLDKVSYLEEDSQKYSEESIMIS
ncbi:MAG: hypothetical protein Q9214_001262 [Letrouitia sp. 1 TL-2023]